MVDPQPAAPAFDPIESLEAFAHIGYGGTPPGMITSGWSNTATGQIGGGEVTEDSEDKVPATTGHVGLMRGLGVTFVLVCVGALGLVLYMRANAGVSAEPAASEPQQIVVAPPPTTELEQVPSVPSAARDPDGEGEQEAEPEAGRHKPKNGRARKPSEPQPQCDVIVKEAERAARRGRHSDVERLTRESPQCWKSTLERKQLRMRALFELDRFEECIKLGRGSSNATIERLADGCRKASRK